MKYRHLLMAGGVLAVALTPGVFAGAVVLYDNTASTGVGPFWPVALEDGNQVFLAGGTAADITQFKFQYYNNDLAGTELLDFRIYANDGPEFFPGDPTSKEPGTKLFDSGTFSALYTSTGLSSVLFDSSYFGAGGLKVPNSFTWTVQFSNLGTGGHAGVELYRGPTVGQAYDEIWVNTGTWQLTGSVPPNSNFGAQITGIVPEPYEYGLVFGAISLLPLVWNRRGAKV